ncbi:putative phage abortive infection protein [Algoriphagus winogradskyi]|uniref:Phage abortive infection protein n=1 Tax=Algoriphagus winogradskyi TaxID=237017 RepID=A0ABY1P9U2_9BACT|nr:putative phage abortive infection protein [Algoriphagus winogradskyi]SMP29800.1 Putative phage abortive infection protein [Algoriphagus winogradskyi]
MNKKRSTASLRITFSIFLTALGAIIFILFIGELAYEGWINFYTINSERAGQTGDFIGGIVGSIFTIVGIVLLYETLSLQRQEFIASRKVFQTQQFENKYFSLIQLYNNIVNSFHLEINNHSYKGKEFFAKKKQIILSTFIPANSYFKDQKQAIALYSNFYIAEREILGQYFRTLYRIFELIETTIEDTEEKLSYIKIIRGQLSESELFFLKYNAWTTFGEKFRPYIINHNLVKHLPILERMEFNQFKKQLNSEEKSSAVSLVFEEINIFLKTKNTDYYKTYLKGMFAFKITRAREKVDIEIFRTNTATFSNFLQEGYGLNNLSNKDIEKLLKYWFLEFFYSRHYIENKNPNLKFKVDIQTISPTKFKIICNIYSSDGFELAI